MGKMGPKDKPHVSGRGLHGGVDALGLLHHGRALLLKEMKMDRLKVPAAPLIGLLAAVGEDHLQLRVQGRYIRQGPGHHSGGVVVEPLGVQEVGVRSFNNQGIMGICLQLTQDLMEGVQPAQLCQEVFQRSSFPPLL